MFCCVRFCARNGRATSHTLPLLQTETFTYDGNGNTLTKTDFNGATIAYAYDANHRLLSKTYPDATQVTFTYTATGQRETATDARGVTSYAYDLRDRLTEQTNPEGTYLRYAYDEAGNRTVLTIPSRTEEGRFLERLGELLGATGARLYAWCLLSNHFHFRYADTVTSWSRGGTRGIDTNSQAGGWCAAPGGGRRWQVASSKTERRPTSVFSRTKDPLRDIAHPSAQTVRQMSQECQSRRLRICRHGRCIGETQGIALPHGALGKR